MTDKTLVLSIVSLVPMLSIALLHGCKDPSRTSDAVIPSVVEEQGDSVDPSVVEEAGKDTSSEVRAVRSGP